MNVCSPLKDLISGQWRRGWWRRWWWQRQRWCWNKHLLLRVDAPHTQCYERPKKTRWTTNCVVWWYKPAAKSNAQFLSYQRVTTQKTSRVPCERMANRDGDTETEISMEAMPLATSRCSVAAASCSSDRLCFCDCLCKPEETVERRKKYTWSGGNLMAEAAGPKVWRCEPVIQTAIFNITVLLSKALDFVLFQQNFDRSTAVT